MKKRTLLILLAVVALAVLPLLIHWNRGGEGKFSGSDDQAEKMITQIQPNYKPWFRSIWEPPSAEIASLLFALQAALGAGVLGYYLGLVRGRALARSKPDRFDPAGPQADRLASAGCEPPQTHCLERAEGRKRASDSAPH